MRFSLSIKQGADTISPIMASYTSRSVICESPECVVSALQSLGGQIATYTNVDLFQDETIQLTRAIKDFITTAARTDFTQQFNIPSTAVNDPLFQNYFDENSVFDGWNAFLKLDAIIYIHSIPIFKGCVELTSVEFKNGLPRQYNLIFYGQGKTAIADFGEKTLPMVNWDAYNHIVNVSNVLDSWDGNLLGGKILYPLADWHIGLRYCKSIAVDNNLYSGGIDVNDLRPSILLKEMVTACFADIGYTLSGTLLDKANFNDLYVAPMSGAGPVQNTNNEDGKIDVSKGILSTPNTTFQPTPLVFDTITSDPLGLYNAGTGEYTVPYNGEYTFRLTIDISNPSGSPFNFITIGTTANAQTFSYTTSGIRAESATLQLNKGDIVQVYYYFLSGISYNSIQLEIVEVPYGIESTVMDLGIVMPEVKVSDFINGFLRTYNAVLIPTTDTNFELHNIDDYYALGETKEWTEYIDMTDIRHEKVPIPRKIEMMHQEAEDLANVQYEAINNQAYGSVKASPEVDFANDELNIESPFSILVPSLLNEQNFQGLKIRQTPFQIPVVLDDDLKPVKSDFYLFYYNGLINTGTDRFQFNGINYFSYPMVSSYQDFPTTSTTKSLAFGMEATISGDAPTASIYNDFFKAYLSRIFSTKSRIVHFDAILPVNEWLQLQMNDTIAVSGNYYKIQNIEYDILNERAHLVLFSYPNVELQTYTSTGNNTGWQDAQERPDGVTTLNGDAVGRGVTNSKPLFGGGTGVTVLGKKVFNDTTMQKVRDAVNEMLKGRNVIVAYNETPTAIVIPETGIFEPIPLSNNYTLGNPYYYLLSSPVIAVNVSARYKVTAEIGYQHTHGHNMDFAILVNGLVTSGYSFVGKFDQSTSISEVFDLGAGSEVSVGISSPDGFILNVDIQSIKVRIERL